MIYTKEETKLSWCTAVASDLFGFPVQALRRRTKIKPISDIRYIIFSYAHFALGMKILDIGPSFGVQYGRVSSACTNHEGNMLDRDYRDSYEAFVNAMEAVEA